MKKWSRVKSNIIKHGNTISLQHEVKCVLCIIAHLQNLTGKVAVHLQYSNRDLEPLHFPATNSPETH